MNGIKKEGSRIAVILPELYLTQAIEFIPATETAIRSFGEINE
jgi:hypothetical protein